MFLTSDFSKRYEKLPVKIFNEQKEASKIKDKRRGKGIQRKSSEGGGL